jgi:hypothetical protein
MQGVLLNRDMTIARDVLRMRCSIPCQLDGLGGAACDVRHEMTCANQVPAPAAC